MVSNESNSWGQHHDSNRLSDETDQVEWKAIQLGNCSFSSTQIDDLVSGQLIENQSLNESSVLDEQDSANSTEKEIEQKLIKITREKQRALDKREEIISGVKNEVQRRRELLGDSYPFVISEGGLKHAPKTAPDHEAYRFLLKLSMEPSSSDRSKFEEFVGKAMCSYLGKWSRVQSFGWRSDVEGDRPSKIKQKIELLYSECSEWKWCPDADFPDDPSSQLVKDMGLDVIAWKPMPDKRIGQIFLVIQCATGRSNWDSKLGDINWGRIGNWVRPSPQSWSIRGIAIPFHLPNQGQWKDVSMQGGILFDRVRLTLLHRE